MDTRRRWCWTTLLLCASFVIIINPLTTALASPVRVWSVWVGLLDCWLVVPAGLAAWHLRTGRTIHFRALVASAALTPAIIVLIEVGVAASWQAYGDRVRGEVVSGLYVPAPAGWALARSTTARHARRGQYDVEYVLDEHGRRAIPEAPGAHGTLRVFGDSFTFGIGVSNDEAWLDLLARRLKPEVSVANYGVAGYGLAQMLVRLEENVGDVHAGDLVVFSPIADDLLRGLIYKEPACVIFSQLQMDRLDTVTYPTRRGERLVYEQLVDHCSGLPGFVWSSPGLLSAAAKVWLLRRSIPTILRDADWIFERAETLVEGRGARFRLVFLPTADDCELGRPSLDIAALETPHVSLLPLCPTDTSEIRRLYYREGHFAPEGNRWVADAFRRTLADDLAELEGQVASRSWHRTSPDGRPE